VSNGEAIDSGPVDGRVVNGAAIDGHALPHHVVDVLVVDDHALMRSGLRAMIEAAADMRVVGTAADGAEALAAVARLRPHVVLMDLSMPVMDGAAATRRLTEQYPGVEVLVVTSFSDRDRVVDALDAGASGYVLKDAEPGELLAAIRSTARGESPLDPRVARTLLHARRGSAGLPELTEREREVLALVGRGLANKQIARSLGIRESTVKAHLTNVFQRIGVRDRTSAALWARSHLADGSGPGTR
jgi:DNA-binding NarL/FixJ family response regulator